MNKSGDVIEATTTEFLAMMGGRKECPICKGKRGVDAEQVSFLLKKYVCRDCKTTFLIRLVEEEVKE